MENCKIIDKFINLYDIIIPITVVRELDHLKTNIDIEKSSKAKKAIRKLEQYKSNIAFDLEDYKDESLKLESSLHDSVINDDLILFCAKKHSASMCTNDLAIKIKATACGVECVEIIEDSCCYTGYKYVTLNEDDMSNFYINKKDNVFDCLINQYLIIKNTDDEIVDKVRWNGEEFVNIKRKTIKNVYYGDVKPRNVEQELLIDLFLNNDIPIKAVKGAFGSGKTMLSLVSALHLVDTGKYNNIFYLRNNFSVKNTKEIGYLPGTAFEKILPFALPLADHVGGIGELQTLIDSHKIEIEHLGYIRGRDISDKIVIVNEAENLTKEHVQLILSRAAKGTTIWFDGDTKQIDDSLFERNNGLTSIIDKFKGNPLFGCVQLNKTERSEIARLSDLLN